MNSVTESNAPLEPQKDERSDPGEEENEFVLPEKAPVNLRRGKATLNKLQEINSVWMRNHELHSSMEICP